MTNRVKLTVRLPGQNLDYLKRYAAEHDMTVTEVLAQASDAAPAAVGAYRIRAPLKPVSLGELASLAQPPDAGGG